MKTQPGEFFDWIVAATSIELFASYGIGLRRKTDKPPAGKSHPPEQCSGGLLNFSSDPLNGTILLVGSFDFLSASRPLEHQRKKQLSVNSAADWILVRDWSMELANQLFGRIRNRLYGYRVSLDAKCPTAVSGPSLALAMRSRTTTPYEFVTSASPHYTVRIWFDAQVSPGFEPDVLRDGATFQKEGDTVLF